ncbi:MAG: hypothetical protein AAF843_20190 [Bacteroidota bacterium]
MKLTPGLYKLRSRNKFDPECVYLHVFGFEKKLYYTINGSAGSPADEYNNIPLDGYELIKKLAHPVVDKAKMTLTWTDPEGDHYSKQFSNVKEMRNFFERYPELARSIGSKKY